jgi:hypothetical protein
MMPLCETYNNLLYFNILTQFFLRFANGIYLSVCELKIYFIVIVISDRSNLKVWLHGYNA